MAKVNLVWEKARLRLDNSKLKLLHHELRVHDKEELALKKIKSEDGDNEGLREAEVRKRFNSILNHYGLGGSSAEVEGGLESNIKSNLRVFKDKKLDRLWEKAKAASGTSGKGMSDEELAVLKREFQHYQEKQDELHRLMEVSGKASEDPSVLREKRRINSVDEDFELFADEIDEADSVKHINSLQADEDSMKKELKRHYHKLKRMATGQPGTLDFEEPKVQGLWRMAQEAEFSSEELDSLRIELKHYEATVQKLHVMKAEISYMDERSSDSNASDPNSDLSDDLGGDLRKRMEKKMRKHSDSVNEVHQELERKIFARHSEL